MTESAYMLNMTSRSALQYGTLQLRKSSWKRIRLRTDYVAGWTALSSFRAPNLSGPIRAQFRYTNRQRLRPRPIPAVYQRSLHGAKRSVGLQRSPLHANCLLDQAQ